MGLIPGSGDLLEKGMAIDSSSHARRIPWTEEPGRLQSTRLHRVRHDWSYLARTQARTLWLLLGGGGPSAGQVISWQMMLSPCGWATASHKTNHLRVKGSLGLPSSRNKCGDTTMCWHGRSHKERETLRASVLRELQFNQSPQVHEHWKSALAIPEIDHVTSGFGSVLSHRSD